MIIDPYISLNKESYDREYITDMIESLISLGYGGAFFVTEIKDREISEEDACDPSLLIHCLSKSQQTALTRDESVTHSNEFVPYSRLSFSTSRRNILNSFNSPIANSYDVVSCLPQNQDVYDHACKCSFIDIIEIPVDIALPFKVTKDSIDQAIKNGIHFEFTYASTLHDRSSRRSLLSSSHNIVVFGRGNNLLMGSNPHHPLEIRSPRDCVTLVNLMDVPFEKATAAVYRNPHVVLLHARTDIE